MSARESDLRMPWTIVGCIDDIAETVEAFRFGYDNYVYPESVLDHTCRRPIEMLMLQLSILSTSPEQEGCATFYP